MVFQILQAHRFRAARLATAIALCFAVQVTARAHRRLPETGSSAARLASGAGEFGPNGFKFSTQKKRAADVRPLVISYRPRIGPLVTAEEFEEEKSYAPGTCLQPYTCNGTCMRPTCLSRAATAGRRKLMLKEDPVELDPAVFAVEALAEGSDVWVHSSSANNGAGGWCPGTVLAVLKIPTTGIFSSVEYLRVQYSIDSKSEAPCKCRLGQYLKLKMWMPEEIQHAGMSCSLGQCGGTGRVAVSFDHSKDVPRDRSLVRPRPDRHSL